MLAFGCKPARETPLKNQVQDKIDSYISEYVNRVSIAGLAVAITRNDSVIYSNAFGYRDFEKKEPMKVNYFFHWASVSKTFVGTAVMQLVEQKKLRLDEKLITYLPYFKLNDPNYKSITLRQMLNHTSGFGDVDDYEWDKPQYDEGAPERYARSLANDKMLFAPCTNWRYSNTAYEVLGVLITKVSGMPFETYIKKNIFEPLGMTTTSFIYPEIPDSVRVKGHIWADEPLVSKVYPYNRIHAPSSTLNSNVPEMTHYAMANLHRGEYHGKRILADSSYNVLWANSVNMKEKPAIGVSWWLSERQGEKTVSHGGGDTGFRSYLLLVPEKNISIEIASNYELTHTGTLASALLALVLNKQPEVIKHGIGFGFAEVLKKKGLDSAKAFYQKINADTAQNKYWEKDEEAMTYPGFLLLEEKMYDDALTLFKYNLELHPTSGDAYGNLARAYAKAGDKKLSAENFKKAIALLPKDEDLKEELRKVEH